MNKKKRKNIFTKIEEFDRKLPHFVDGRIDYRNSREAAIATIFIGYRGKILLLKRSDKVGNYKGRWSTVTGYLDEVLPIEEQIKRELEEELGISMEQIQSLIIADYLRIEDGIINKIWYGVPALAKFKEKPHFRLDWEHSEFRWVWPEEIKNYQTVPDLDTNLKSVGLLT